jgi:redox-sensing transcriptional repressor
MMKNIPVPTIERLSALYALLCRMDKEGTQTLSSKKIGGIMGISPYTVRKDINYLTGSGKEAGYSVRELMDSLYVLFGLEKERKACIVGMGRLGCAIMNFCQNTEENIKIVAGFDSNINVIETLESSIPVFPACDIPEIVRSMDIGIGVITVPPNHAQITADRLIKGGVKGIINFAPVVIRSDNEDITIKNFHIMEEFRTLSIMMDQKEKEKRHGQDI